MVTFHLEAVTPACQQALDFLREQEFIRHFYLAGGTALALQMRHRISTDLDWFTSERTLRAAERDDIRHALEKSGQLEIRSEQDGMIYIQLFGAEVSFVYQHHPLLEPTVDFDGIPLASLTDIGLMKLAAINSRGTRRDFVDLYCLRETVSLDRLLELAEVKYADRPSFLSIAARALVYFEDAEPQPMPEMLTPVEWPEVKLYCADAAVRLVGRLLGR
jgi:predicted nucleotidyltransferase component of viral defense system